MMVKILKILFKIAFSIFYYIDVYHIIKYPRLNQSTHKLCCVGSAIMITVHALPRRKLAYV